MTDDAADLERRRIERLFDAIESHPNEGERPRVEAVLRAPATKLDVASALVLQSQFNTELASIISDLSAGRAVDPRELVRIAKLQQGFGLEMVDFLTATFRSLDD
jgi:hypothetical protein